MNTTSYFSAREEESEFRGCVLAEAIGLGKTLEIIHLVSLSTKTTFSSEDFNRDRISPCTLVICPAHICRQWGTEVKKFSKLSVIVLTNIKEWEETTMGQLNDPELILVVSMDLIASNTYQRYHY